MLLSMQDVDFYVGKTQILRSVNLEVGKGEIVGLLGRNGAGKSSILKSILGLYQPKAGRVTFLDQDVTNAPPRQRVLMGMGYQPEDARVFPELTVAENVNMGLWVTEDRQEGNFFELEQGFEIFPKLQELWDRRGGNLSGGEKKMVSITRALALSPRLLLLDESFEGLAPLVVRHFMDALRRIRDLGISILLAASNLGNASRIVERAYVVERGEILFTGTPEEIAANEKLTTIVGR
jgi:branched-chain amino acid transport system ATP-binding protein